MAASMNRFRKDLIPPPRQFYERELGQLTRPDRKGWALANCPFHRSKSRRSFSVKLDSGAFHCFGCDAKGGDIVSFVMQRDGCTFKEACHRLNCWDDAGRRSKAPAGPLLRYLMDFVIDGARHHAEVPDEPVTELARLRRIHAEAKDRLGEIRHGATERFEGEEAIQWLILADSWELIEMEVER